MSLQKIGRYDVNAELGRGGMATVYLATDPRFKRKVAIKVLPREFLHEPTFKARFEREAQTIATLEHPAILPVYDFGEDDGQPFIVMRYLPGGSLADTLHQRRPTLEEVMHIMERLGAALDEAHNKGIIHRDLKPGNIMFDQRGEPYLSDFGIAKLAEAAGGTLTGGGVIGTPAYMSPEQAKGSANIDGRSDIYSLGVIFYQLLTGDIPYKADTPIGLVVKHITDPVPSLKEASPHLKIFDGVIQKALAKNPDDRYSTATEMSNDIRQVIADSKGAAQTAWATVGRLGMIPPQQTAGQQPPTPTPTPTPTPSASESAATMVESEAPAAYESTSAATMVESGPPVVPAPPGPAATMVESGLPPSTTPPPARQTRPEPARPAAAPVSPAATAPPAQKSGPSMGLIIGGGIALLVVIVLGVALLGGGALLAANMNLGGGGGNGGGGGAATPEPDAEATQIAGVVVEEDTPTATATATEAPTETPTATYTPTWTPTPDVDFVEITGIELVNNAYSVSFVTYNYTPVLPGKHIHFYFNTVTEANSGAPGSGPWQIYGGASPFNLLGPGNRPQAATQMCAIVANADHSYQPGSGTCWNLP